MGQPCASEFSRKTCEGCIAIYQEGQLAAKRTFPIAAADGSCSRLGEPFQQEPLFRPSYSNEKPFLAPVLRDTVYFTLHPNASGFSMGDRVRGEIQKSFAYMEAKLGEGSFAWGGVGEGAKRKTCKRHFTASYDVFT
eukprot:jgi/Botrbrau1/2996/Bobra.0026s0054.1